MLSLIRARSVLSRRTLSRAHSHRLYSETPVAAPAEPDALRSADDLLKELTDKLGATSSTNFWKELEKIEIKPFVQIEREIQERVAARYHAPSQEWLAQIPAKPLKSEASAVLTATYGPTQSFIRPNDLSSPVDIGDVVELRGDFHKPFLHVVAAVPSGPLDSRYTLISHTGQVHYLGRQSFRFRIPGFFPKPWLANAIVKERRMDGYAAVGVTKETSNFQGNEFLVDNAASQSSLETYLVPETVRAVLSQPLIACMDSAWSSLSRISQKLEMIHRVVQNLSGPTSISLFTLVKAVQAMDLDYLKQRFVAAGSDPRKVESVYAEICTVLSVQTHEKWTVGNTVLGKNYGQLDPGEKFDAAEMFAVILALRKQNRLWGDLNVVTGFSGPISVVALPLSMGVRLEEIVNDLKLSPETFTLYLENITTRVDFQAYDNVVYLLKKYVAGGITDAPTETMIVKLLRSMPQFRETDISRTSAFTLLQALGEVRSEENPVTWSAELALPHSETSPKSDSEQEYHQLFEVNGDSDPLEGIREDFGELPVYCIDSATAHEIDDGVSIQRTSNDEWEVMIHIADPASHIRPDSPLARIAFDRASTVYLPEKVLPMLPKQISDVVGLGKDGVSTRCVTYSFKVNPKETGSKFVDRSSLRVRAGTVRNFPKATYSDVDDILAGKMNVSASMTQDLQDMLEVGRALRKMRIKSGAIVFGTSPDDVEMTLTQDITLQREDLADSPIQLSFSPKQETSSQVLVSELMIMANHISGSFFRDNQIPGVFRQFRMPKVDDSIAQVFQNLSRRCAQGDYPPLTDIAKVSAFMSASTYTTQNASPHEMLGVVSYNPSTSPLRRFGDMVSHWQVHAHLLGQHMGQAPIYPFSMAQMNYIAFHIQTRDQIIKRSVKRSVAYWVHAHLARLLERVPKTTFDALVMSSPVNGTVRASLVNYGIHCRISIDPETRPPVIGDMLIGCSIGALDVVEGELVLQCKKACED
ncbi:hypothetical protein BABINDRAFT_163703 [Babjeviella inositovora NRRL Y-12698]|uniref:RNB domain-containing protein n=1 Tax=Babjeviella inositovora NRRL Y-12698 TaxID=984486 RepID=A0A1E3QHM1_9ASCO|nr:uncharacterized protein BABINDRAFT_163703 [Babjeviella inositovora NRRL Y-12698]ODQ77195.1 hypothetical protein BABINDRAFT_163703 [Babjeviella inositovora NRRL Y-12698]